MKLFSIKELEQFSGIKAHTIRIWEQRHFIFSPQRTEGNLRRYNLPDLKLLLDISLLVSNGYKISKLALSTPTGITQKAALLKDKDARQRRSVNDLICCMYSSEIEEFDEVIEDALLSWGLDLTIREIIIPFLERVQLISYRKSSSEAHFAVTAIRRKLIFGIESLNMPAADNRTVLLFLPLGEHYDLMLLYVYYALKKEGLRPLYLGTNISKENLEEICIEKKPSFLFSYTYPQQNIRLQGYSNFLNTQLPGTTLYIAHVGTPSHYSSDLPNIRFINYNELKEIITRPL